MSAQKRVQPPLVPLEQFAQTPGGQTFVPAAAPAPAPAPTRWPQRDDLVTACDVEGRSGPAAVTAVVARDGQPEVYVRPFHGDLRLPTSRGGLLAYSAVPRPSSWRWPDA